MKLGYTAAMQPWTEIMKSSVVQSTFRKGKEKGKGKVVLSCVIQKSQGDLESVVSTAL